MALANNSFHRVVQKCMYNIVSPHPRNTNVKQRRWLSFRLLSFSIHHSDYLALHVHVSRSAGTRLEVALVHAQP